MKRLLAGVLSLSLGWFAASATADELDWRPAKDRPAAGAPVVPVHANNSPVVTVGKPVVISAPIQPASPAPISPVAATDRIGQTSLKSSTSGRVVRAKGPDLIPTQLPEVLQENGETPSSALSLVSSGFASDSIYAGSMDEGAPVIGHLPSVESGPALASGPVYYGEPMGVETFGGNGGCNCGGACQGGGCDGGGEGGGCCGCGSGTGSRFYVRGEYLLWGIRDGRVPPLVTTTPSVDGITTGALGAPGTTLLFGGSRLDQELQSGGRLTAGYWFDPCENWGIEGSGFFLVRRSVRFSALSDLTGRPVLARPFTNPTGIPASQLAELTTVPDFARDGPVIDAPTRLWGAELDGRFKICCGCWYRVDLLAGFRYVQLDEGVHITENITTMGPIPPVPPAFPIGLPAGTQISVADRFDTRNQFFGGQIGTVAEFHKGPWLFEVRTKVALGETHEVLDINGAQVVTPPGMPQQRFAGGLLAVSNNGTPFPGNIGHYTRNRFSVVPEVGLNVGYDVTSHLRVMVGYNFLYWSRVIRPGDQIDTRIDPNKIPNFVPLSAATFGPPVPNAPSVPFKEAGFWAQGVSCGLEFHY
jgi:hypothetical protein